MAKKKKRKNGKTRITPLEFFTRFLLVFGVAYLSLIVLSDGLLSSLFTQLQSVALNWQGVPHSIQDNYVFFDSAIYHLNQSCIGIVSTSMILGLLASSVGVSRKNAWRIALIGISFMALFNFARVFLVLNVGYSVGFQEAESLHVLTWFVMAGVTAFVWYYLIQAIEKPKRFSDIVRR